MKRTTVVFAVLVVSLATPLSAQTGAVKGTYQAGGNYGILGSTNGHGVLGVGDSLFGVGVYGIGATYGVQGNSNGNGGDGVLGQSLGSSSKGVFGVALGTSSYGVYGQCETNGSYGVYGMASYGYAIYGQSTANGWAGWFQGDVKVTGSNGNLTVTGTLYKSAGAFKIDHPLDPFNQWLSHSFVESDEMKNVYDGVVTLDGSGEAVVELPKWFEALNKDFRYQLTCIGRNAPVYIADEVTENKFRIAGGRPGMKISWQVTGVRRDPYAVAHPIVVEQPKHPNERGRLQHPELYGQPESMRIDYETTQHRPSPVSPK